MTTKSFPKRGKNKKDAFVDFEKTTIDAWDASDDELSCMTSAKLSIREPINIGGALIKTKQVSPRESSGSNSRASSPKTSMFARNIKDPVSRSSSVPNTPSHNLSGHRFIGASSQKHSSSRNHVELDSTKKDKFKAMLENSTKVESSTSLDLEELRKISWSGIPSSYRPITWKLLCGYLPAVVERREAMLGQKRTEYHNFVLRYYGTRFDESHADTYQQIHIDVPRMSPLIPLFQQQCVRDIFERILFIWSIRHPASGYVQGINDLVTPFFVVFLAEYIPPSSGVSVEQCQVCEIASASLQSLEADCFWCFSKLLEGIQDYYTFAQPGIQTRINSLKDLVQRIDSSLHKHLLNHNIDYLQFSYRWMNNLLMRELPLACVVRLWDTYLSERDGFASFHLYVCAAFLTHFSAKLQRETDFHSLMTLLQNLPTRHWSEEQVGVVLAEAYRLKFTFADAPSHFRDNGVVGVRGGGAVGGVK